MSNYRKALGNWGERKAEEFLLQRGYTFLDRNVRTPHGEIDLVVSQDIQLPNINEPQSTLSSRIVVFVEVKTRTNPVFGLPEKFDHFQETISFAGFSSGLFNGSSRAGWRLARGRDRDPTCCSRSITAHHPFRECLCLSQLDFPRP